MFDTSPEVSRFHNTKVTLPTTERKNMRARRDANRNRLRSDLTAAEKPAPIGLHTQGSYAMHTMVQDAATDYDIDDGVYFKAGELVGANGGAMSALAVRQMVCAALQYDGFKTAPTVLKNCVRVYYNEGFHVDVPAYRRYESADLWTGKPKYTYELASSDWKSSDPREVTKWFRKRNVQHSLDCSTSDGQFRRVVRLLKMFARSRSSWKSLTATGFMITKLADEHFVASEGRDDLSLRQTMQAIHVQLGWNTSIGHPTLTGETITRDNDPRPGYFKDRLAENLKHLEVLDTHACTHEAAMKAWDTVFATDWFSQQQAPSGGSGGSGSSGGNKSAFIPTQAVEKRDGGRYARLRLV